MGIALQHKHLQDGDFLTKELFKFFLAHDEDFTEVWLRVKWCEGSFDVRKDSHNFIMAPIPCEVDAYDILASSRAQRNIIGTGSSEFSDLDKMHELLPDVI